MLIFGWDPKKRALNLEAHDVDFVDIMPALEDPNQLEREDKREDYGEKRFQVLGRSRGICFFVVYTDIDDPPPKTRWIISAREAEPYEEKELRQSKHRSGWRRVET